MNALHVSLNGLYVDLAARGPSRRQSMLHEKEPDSRRQMFFCRRDELPALACAFRPVAKDAQRRTRLPSPDLGEELGGARVQVVLVDMRHAGSIFPAPLNARS